MRVTIFSTGGEIPPCFDFYIATRSYSSRPFLCALAAPQDAHKKLVLQVAEWLTASLSGFKRAARHELTT